MSQIGEKLRLYSGPRVVAKERTENASDEILHFGEFSFLRENGSYVRRQTVKSPHAGKSLHEYMPMGFSGILDLALVSSPDPIHPEDVIFLDTETTGLSRGTGNFPFLTGLAYFHRGALQVEQHFLNEISDEGAYLEAIFASLSRFRYLVTYNGKSFDIPLLRTRLVMNRKKIGVELTHFDLLHIFRRLVPKPSMRSYRQQEMESQFLGFERVEDTSGALIPQIYFDYKKYGQSEPMGGVFEHNEKDLTGMVFLFLEAVRIYDSRDTGRSALRSGLARILARNNRHGEAIEMLSVIENSEMDDFRYRDLLFLGSLLRRGGRITEAAGIYDLVARQYECQYSFVALAKIYEHKIKDLSAALEHTESALRIRGGPFRESDLKKRQERLRRKAERKGKEKSNGKGNDIS